MLVFGVDAHKRSHTIVAVDEHGRQRGVADDRRNDPPISTRCAGRSGSASERLWAIEDCRHLSRRLERDLLVAGERIVRVPPKLMASARNSARSFGKSDPIDALAVARAALREPDLPVAVLDGPDRDVRLLVDHRENLVAERTRASAGCAGTCTSSTPSSTRRPARWTGQQLRQARGPPRRFDGVVARLAARYSPAAASSPTRSTSSNRDHHARHRTRPVAAGHRRLRTAHRREDPRRDRRRRPGSDPRTPSPATTAPRRCRCGRPTTRHRLSRTGNRQLNAALHRIALTQSRTAPARQSSSTPAGEADGDGGLEALRVLKRRLSDVVFRALLADHAATTNTRRLDRGARRRWPHQWWTPPATPKPTTQGTPTWPAGNGQRRRGRYEPAKRRVIGCRHAANTLAASEKQTPCQ